MSHIQSNEDSMKSAAQQDHEIRAGWSVIQFSRACGFSRACFYLLKFPPRSIKIGKRRIVVEPPSEYLARLAAAQEAA